MAPWDSQHSDWGCSLISKYATWYVWHTTARRACSCDLLIVCVTSPDAMNLGLKETRGAHAQCRMTISSSNENGVHVRMLPGVVNAGEISGCSGGFQRAQ
jgi:hypothetical protein